MVNIILNIADKAVMIEIPGTIYQLIIHFQWIEIYNVYQKWYTV